MKKSIIVILLLCFIIVGCSKGKEGENEKIVEPIKEGEYEVKVIDLKFYVPKELTVNSYNGINSTYNYYIENSDDNCNVLLILNSKSSYNDDIKKYMSDYIKSSDYDEETINNGKWYVTSSNDKVSYSIKYNDYFYSVSLETKKNGTVCSKTNDMIKETLYLLNNN